MGTITLFTAKRMNDERESYILFYTHNHIKWFPVVSLQQFWLLLLLSRPKTKHTRHAGTLMVRSHSSLEPESLSSTCIARTSAAEQSRKTYQNVFSRWQEAAPPPAAVALKI